MTELTRRLMNERSECWGIFYGDVRVGTISKHHGVGRDKVWQWHCGFNPGCRPGEDTSGSNPTFDGAREEFHRAWNVLLPKKTEADFQECRDWHAWTDYKYALWDAGKKLPPNEWEPGKPCSIWIKCECGEIFNSHSLEANLIHLPHIQKPSEMMCNLYSMTKNVDAIRRLFGALNHSVGNLPSMPAIFPDYEAPVVRHNDADRELVMMRWGMPSPPQFGGGPITNIRNTTSAHWRRWLKPESRCLVPFTSFSEYNDVPHPKTLKNS